MDAKFDVITSLFLMQPRTRYRTTQHDIEVLERGFRTTGSCTAMALAMGMKARTARKYNDMFLHGNGAPIILKRRGGSTKHLLDAVQIKYMTSLVKGHQDITFEEIQRKMHVQYPGIPQTKLCISTIWNYLDGKLITTKLIRYIHPDANTPANKVARVNYLNNFNGIAPGTQQIYVDESNFTIMTRRKCGHSRKGTRAHVTTVLNGCKKINIIHAVSPSIGNVFTEKTDSNVNDDRFDQFITHMLMHLSVNQAGVHFCIILDNAPVHRMGTISVILHQPQFNGLYTILFLPPYTPFLNPIENVFSLIKSKVKEYLRSYNDLMLATTTMKWGQKVNARYQILENAVTYAFQFVTQQAVLDFFNHTKDFYIAIGQQMDINE